MSTVSIDADIKAKWPQGQCSYSPGSPEELAIIGIDLLVKELGTEAARAFVKAHCACGADKIEKNFTTAQIKELMSPQGAKNPQLQQDALNAIAQCKASPKPQ